MTLTFKFKHIAWAIGLFLAAASNSASAIFDDTEARRAILELRQQVKQLEERIARMESTTTQGQLSIAQSLSEKDREIARLRGDLEVAGNNIRKLQEDNRLLYTNLDERIKKLEPKTIQVGGEELNITPDQDSDFQSAMNQFKAGNYQDASRQFQDFLNKYSQSRLEPQVRYFLGSAQFALGDYKTALITQRDLLKEFPNSPRAPDAMLSMASSQLELKSIPGAKKTLTDLIARYPGTPAATNAKTRLDALK